MGIYFINDCSEEMNVKLQKSLKDVNDLVDKNNKSLKQAVEISNKYNEKLKESTENIELQYASKLNKVDFKINEVANKGTTVEVIEKATKEEIDRQIQDGTLANMTVIDKSINNAKLSNGAVDMNILSEGIFGSDCYSIFGEAGKKEFIFKGTYKECNGDNKIRFLCYTEISTQADIIIFANNSGDNAGFENEQYRKTIQLNKGYNLIEENLSSFIQSGFSTYLLYFNCTFNNSKMYFRKDIYIDGIQINELTQRTVGSSVSNTDFLPSYLITSKNFTEEIEGVNKQIINSIENHYSDENKSLQVDFKETGKNTFILTFDSSELKSILGKAKGEVITTLEFKDTQDLNYSDVMIWYSNAYSGGYTANDGAGKIKSNIVKHGIRTIITKSPNPCDLNEHPYLKPFISFNVNKPCILDLRIKIEIDGINILPKLKKVEQWEGSLTTKERINPNWLINQSTIDNLKQEIDNKISSLGSPSNRWAGKRYLALGDSITFADGNSEDNGKRLKGYQRILAEKLGMELTTFAVGGMELTHGLRGYFSSDYLQNYVKNAEVISILIGTNDFGTNQPLGDITKYNSISFNEEYIGSYQYMLKKIFEWNPKATIIILTPTHRSNGEDPNTQGLTLLDYVNATRKVADFTSCKCIDLYSYGVINTLNYNEYTIDGLHPNQVGHNLLAEICYKVMMNY
jgi:lysophospholipase L1-like esterase